MSARTPPADGASRAAGFASTQWSVIKEARTDSAGRRAALETLCAAYWAPVYAYLRRRGHHPADAEDLTQGFFLELLEGDFLDRSDPAKGRFRGYLIGALRYFLGTHFEQERAVKRGGRVQSIEWSAPEAEREFAALDRPDSDPSAVYEKSWALTLLARALHRLGEEQTAAGRGRAFAVLRPFLSMTPTRGDYDRAAGELRTTRANVAVWVHRLASRYAELVKLEVAATVLDPAEVKHELLHLMQALRS
ncbi:MAG: sigma-70 family RNA polymerase sigma factor [Verrucomicrobia bacterium]|nr:sigma-70 family RNA polymerase sigma factor [Verrucomicrobiota bacterium]